MSQKWHPLNASDQSTTTRTNLAWITRSYVLALSIVAALVISAYVGFQALLVQHESTLAVVNVAGRQRMLSQRAALFTERLVMGQCADHIQACRIEITKISDLMEESHYSLLNGNRTWDLPKVRGGTINDAYFDGKPSLHDRLNRYFESLNTIAALPEDQLSQDHPAVAYVLQHGPGPLLKDLDTMVKLYQTEGEQNLSDLPRLEKIYVIFTLLILVGEALFIFRPMARHIRKQMNHLTDIQDQLQQTNENLEEMVDVRTQEAQTAMAEAVRANKSKSKFLTQAGHDLMQPMEAAMMLTGILKNEDLSPKGKAVLTDLRRTQKSMAQLVQSVLDLSKLEAGVVHAKLKEMPLEPLFSQMAAEFSALADAKDLKLAILPTKVTVFSDPLLLERIIRNLLSNAIRYTDKGGVVMGVRYREDKITIQITDTGQGIPQEELIRIFDEFAQVESAERDRSEGIGLGLAIVDRMRKLLGHEVTVKSNLGRGTTVTVEMDRYWQFKNSQSLEEKNDAEEA